MGDKSPKSKERNKKQDMLQKKQKIAKKAEDFARAHPAPVAPSKKK
jgi:hypothetical protein